MDEFHISQKERKFTSKKYLLAVADLPCCICETTGDHVVAHHIKGTKQGGTGYKIPDDLTIPLCHGHHSELHDHGHQGWEARYGHQVDFVRLTKKKLENVLLDITLGG